MWGAGSPPTATCSTGWLWAVLSSPPTSKFRAGADGTCMGDLHDSKKASVPRMPFDNFFINCFVKEAWNVKGGRNHNCQQFQSSLTKISSLIDCMILFSLSLEKTFLIASVTASTSQSLSQSQQAMNESLKIKKYLQVLLNNNCRRGNSYYTHHLMSNIIKVEEGNTFELPA